MYFYCVGLAGASFPSPTEHSSINLWLHFFCCLSSLFLSWDVHATLQVQCNKHHVMVIAIWCLVLLAWQWFDCFIRLQKCWTTDLYLTMYHLYTYYFSGPIAWTLTIRNSNFSTLKYLLPYIHSYATNCFIIKYLDLYHTLNLYPS